MKRRLGLTLAGCSLPFLGGCDVIMDIAQDQLLSSAVNYGVNKAISGGNKSSTLSSQSNTAAPKTLSPEWSVQNWQKISAKTPDQIAQEWVNSFNSDVSIRERARIHYGALLNLETGSDLDIVLARSYMASKTWELMVAKNPANAGYFQNKHGQAPEIVYTRGHAGGVRLAGSDLLRRTMRVQLEGLKLAWPQIAPGMPAPAKLDVPESFKNLVSANVDLSHLVGFGSNASAASEEEVREVPSGPTLIGFTVGERRMPVFRNSDGSLYTFDADGLQIDGATVPWTPTDGNQ